MYSITYLTWITTNDWSSSFHLVVDGSINHMGEPKMVIYLRPFDSTFVRAFRRTGPMSSVLLGLSRPISPLSVSPFTFADFTSLRVDLLISLTSPPPTLFPHRRSTHGGSLIPLRRPSSVSLVYLSVFLCFLISDQWQWVQTPNVSLHSSQALLLLRSVRNENRSGCFANPWRWPIAEIKATLCAQKPFHKRRSW